MRICPVAVLSYFRIPSGYSKGLSVCPSLFCMLRHCNRGLFQPCVWACRKRCQGKAVWISVVTLVLLIARGDCCCCGRRRQKSALVVYTAREQIYSEPVFRRFEEKPGVRVRALCDREATKTLRLANRLATEATSPQLDVFWSSEVIGTVMLKRTGGAGAESLGCMLRRT